MPPEQARKVISYRARRFLPSAAGFLGPSDEEAASVGKWKGAGGLCRSETFDLLAMHVRYGDAKLQTARFLGGG